MNSESEINNSVPAYYKRECGTVKNCKNYGDTDEYFYDIRLKDWSILTDTHEGHMRAHAFGILQRKAFRLAPTHPP